MKKIIAIVTAILLICSVIVPIAVSTIAANGTPLTNLYNENYYTEYGNGSYDVTFDKENKNITTSNTHTKAMLNYSTDMTEFKSSVVIGGNAAGQIWAGVNFHAQADDFETNTFRTEGYCAYIVRKANSLNKADIYFQYCTNGSSKKQIVKEMTTGLPSNADLKLRLDISVDSANAEIKLLSENGSTQYGETLVYALDATSTYPATAYYDKGAFILMGNGTNSYSNLSITSYGVMANIPEEEGGNPVSNPLEEKYNLFSAASFSTESDGFTTASATSRAILKSGSKDDFKAELDIKLDDSAETKSGIVFRTSKVGAGNDNMQGYAAIVDTTKDDFVRLYLYKYGPATTTTNVYLGRIGNYVLANNITLTAGKVLTLNLSVKGESFEGYFYDKNDPTARSEVLSVSLKTATDSETNNPTKYPTAENYYSTGDVGIYVAADSFVDASNFAVQSNTGSGGSSSDDSSSDTSSGDTPQNDPLAEKYDLYNQSNFATETNGFTTATATSRAILKNGSKDSFSANLNIKLDNSAETKTGIVFRVTKVGAGSDNMQGYAAIVDTTKDDFVRLYLYKYGPATTSTNAYLGRIGDYVLANNIPLTAGKELTLHINVVDNNFEGYVYDKNDASVKSAVLSADLSSATDSETRDPEKYPTANNYYATGKIGLYIANGYYVDALNFTVSDSEIIGGSGDGGEDITDPLAAKYDLYKATSFSTTADGFTTASTISRAILKSGSKDSFSANLDIKLDADGEAKSGIIFRVVNVDAGSDNMQGYAAIVDTTKDDFVRLYLYKYGPATSAANTYLGRIGEVIIAKNITLTPDKVITLNVNVVDDKFEGYVYEKDDSSVVSDLLSASLKSATDNENRDPQKYPSADNYYSTGKIGIYIASNMFADALGFTVSDAKEIGSGDVSSQTGIPAVDNKIGFAIKGTGNLISNVTNTNVTVPTVKNLSDYSANFDNYTYYSSSASNKFLFADGGITSTTTGAKRAILDGVTVKGFHATATMKISSEGTLRSGIVFRVNDIEKGLAENGTLAANNLEGYAAVLYKTTGNTENNARVVLCIYKYGVKNGVYQYLGTVASKASTVPLEGCEKDITDAAGKELVIDVNVVEDQLTAYFYNAQKPSLKSEPLVTELTAETDIEKGTPSLKGVHYDSGAIGLTATDYVTFTNFSVSEPIYPSNEVGNLSLIESYTLYGSGAKQEGEYITSNSSGTKKLIVNNLDVKDFTASMDMTIDPNGNLKTGLFFRVNEVGNGADDQTGWALVVTRNYATNGESNPNRIDMVLFKWGYANNKLSYLGEVAREVYKSGTTFMDGKMAGEELTLVVSVKGAAIDAALYKKGDLGNKPATFSTNLKFAGDKEKGDVAYYESGSIGLYLGNSVSDPVNYNRVRNFHINDGSGVLVKSTSKGGISKLLSAIPTTGEGIAVTVVSMAFVAALGALIGLQVYNKKGKRENTGDNAR